MSSLSVLHVFLSTEHILTKIATAHRHTCIRKSVVSQHTLYPTIIKFPTLSLLVPMPSTIMETGALIN